ncbi:MAG: ABC transporter ATP-binding protein [Sphaerochaetaceae bacterium]|nr:ABC transporter ATP-binding protein [Sphaerochaetaceae bacterium]
MIEVKNLYVSYGYVEALKNVSLKVDEGEIVSIIGSNGAGKTSLLKSISAIVKPKSGKIFFDNKELPNKPHLVVGKGIIHVPEGRKTFSGLTIQDNLLNGGYRFKNNINKEDLEKQYKLFPILAERKNQFAGTLSGGEQQMLAISRALMSHPTFLLMDEPSLGLAPLIVSQVFNIINKIRESGISILLVEQNAKKALGICDRAYVLENGEIKLQGTGKELLSSDLVRKAYLGS